MGKVTHLLWETRLFYYEKRDSFIMENDFYYGKCDSYIVGKVTFIMGKVIPLFREM